MNLIDKISDEFPKMITSLFTDGNFQSPQSCGVTKNAVKHILSNTDYGDDVNLARTEFVNIEANKMYVISVLPQLGAQQKDHTFVIFIDQDTRTHLFQIELLH